MPPNVKEVANALASLDLSNHVLSKYAPLTSEETASSADAAGTRREEQAEQFVAQHVAPKNVVVTEEQQGADSEYVTSDDANDAYWDMPPTVEETEEEKRQRMIDKILKEEEIRKSLSIGHVEKTLADAAAKKLQDTEESEFVIRSSSSDVDADNYWDMSEPAEDDAKQQETADAGSSLSVHEIEKLLLSEGRRLDSRSLDVEYITAPHVNDATHPLTNYWDWDTSPKTDEQKRAELIGRILEEEAARQKLAVSSIERALVASSAAAEDGSGSVRAPAADVQGAERQYWTWQSRDGDGDEYVVAPHVRDPSHPMANYWDWDAEPKTPDQQRAVVIDWILREEAARRAVSSDGIEGRLVAEAEQRRRQQPTEQVVNNVVAAGGAEGYWDW